MSPAQITALCGATLAQRGSRFLAGDPAKECFRCPLFGQCVGKIQSGRIYEVLEVRSKSLACPIHEGGVVPVVLTEAPTMASIQKRLAVEGLTVGFQTPICFEYDCPNYLNCFPQGLVSGDRVRILEVDGKTKIPCRIGKVLTHVKLERSPRTPSTSSQPLKTSA